MMMQMIAEQTSVPTANMTAVPLSQTRLIYGMMQGGQLIVDRIVSTDPKDFIDPRFSPGMQFCLPEDKI